MKFDLARTLLLSLALAGVTAAQEPGTEKPAPGTEAPAPGPGTDKPAPGPGTEAPAPPTKTEVPPPPASGQPGSTAGVEHFPLESTCRWSYLLTFTVESDSKPEEPADHRLEVYVAEPQVVDGKPAVVLEWKLDGDLSQREYFSVEEGVVRCVKRIHGYGEHMKEYSIDPPMETARRGLAPGQEWSWNGKTGPIVGKQTFKVAPATKKVEVPAGTFDALEVTIEFEGEDDSRGKTTRWLAPGVGVVREVSEVRTASTVFRSEAQLSSYSGPKR